MKRSLAEPRKAFLSGKNRVQSEKTKEKRESMGEIIIRPARADMKPEIAYTEVLIFAVSTPTSFAHFALEPVA